MKMKLQLIILPLLRKKSSLNVPTTSHLVSQTGRFSRIRNRGFSLSVGILLLFYLGHYSYLHHTFGQISNGVYDILWLSNISLGFAAVGMLLQRPLVISIAVACVAFSHISWIFDVSYWLLFDSFQIGRALYLEEQEYDNLWWTTLHQFWFIPLCLLVLYVDYHAFGLPFKSWVYSILIYAVVALIAYFNFNFTDTTIKHKPRQYVLDLNTGHEFWLPAHKDAYNIVHLFDNASLPFYILWRILIEGGLLNGVCFIFLKLLSVLLLEDLEAKIRINPKNDT